jgi:hypothetical protein
MNIYWEDALMRAHQEKVVREVRANRLAKRLRSSDAPGLFGFPRVPFLGLWRIVSRPAAGS